MLLLLGVVAVVGAGGFILSRPRASSSGAGSIVAAPAGPRVAAPAPKPLAVRDVAQPLDLKLIGSGVSVAGTAAGALATAAGVSVGVVAAWAAAVAAIVGFVLLSVFAVSSEVTGLATGRQGYLSGFLMPIGARVSAAFQAQFLARGASALQARAAATLFGFYEAVGYNRAALAFALKGGNAADAAQAGNVGYWADRGQCLAEAGEVFMSGAERLTRTVPGYPIPYVGIESLESRMFGPRGVAGAKEDAGPFWSADLEAVADFTGRALRCEWAKRNPAVGGGLTFTIDTGDYALLAASFVTFGMIGANPGGVALDAERLDELRAGKVVDRAMVMTSQGPRLGSGLAWFFMATQPRDGAGNTLPNVRVNA